jgi:CreA protein
MMRFQNKKRMTGYFILTMILLLSIAGSAVAEQIGSVSTKFKLLGANDKIVIEAFDDPEIPGATCYLSRAKTGGVSGTVGVAEDTSDASIACRQIGPITLPEKVKNGHEDGKEVFKKSTSLLFKTLQVVRFYDPKRNVLVYLTYSDRIIEGSPKNSISIIPVTPWH